MNRQVIGIAALGVAALGVIGYVALRDDTPAPRLAVATSTSSLPIDKAIPTAVPTQPTAVSVVPTSVKVSARVTLTGAASFIDQYETEPSSRVPNVSTCAQLAKSGHDDAVYHVPFPDENSSMNGGHRLTELVSWTTYAGPNTYTGDSMDPTSFIVVDRVVGETSNIGFFPDVKPNATLVVKADNSGSFEFSDWKNPEGKSLSGKIEWTCTDAAAPTEIGTTSNP